MVPIMSPRKFLSKYTSLEVFYTGAPNNSKRQNQVSAHKAAGFTLVELLVVIAIISLLASVIFSSFSGARESARDAVRFQDFDEMTTALEVYNLKFGVYPCGDSGVIEHDDEGNSYTIDTSLSDGFLSGPESSSQPGCDGPTTGIDDAGLYPQHTREDPVNEEDSYYYTYQVTVDRNNYILFVPLESSERAEEDGGTCDNYYEAGSGVGEIDVLIERTWLDAPYPCND